MGELNVDDTMIIICMLNELVVRMRIGFKWLRAVSRCVFL